jgi:transposase
MPRKKKPQETPEEKAHREKVEELARTEPFDGRHDVRFGKKVSYSPLRREAVQKRLLDALSLGCYIKEAVAYAGIHYNTYQNWINDNKKFREAVHEAIAKSETLLLAEIRRDPSWQAKAWILERRFRDRWAREVKTDADNIPRTITLTWAGENGVDRIIEATPQPAQEEQSNTQAAQEEE